MKKFYLLIVSALVLVSSPRGFVPCAAAPAPAGASLLVNGDFKTLDENGRPAGWAVSGGGVTVVADGGRTSLSLKTTALGTASAVQELALDPSWGILRFTGAVRVNSIAPGKEGWHDARIALTFLGPGNKVTHLTTGEWKEPTDGWVRIEQDVQIPAGATKLRVSPSIFEAVADWELRDLRVEMVGRRGEGMDAPVPAGQSVTWGLEPVEELGPRRGAICLNGLWRIQPAPGPATNAPPKTGWGWIRVPGSWRAWGSFEGATRASGPAWEKFNNDTPVAWYERDIEIPAAWAGRAVLLDLHRVSTDAVVFVDDREAGRVTWPGGQVELTSMVRPGSSHRLRLKVVATANATEVTRFMGTGEGQVLTEKFTLGASGLIGDALLVSRPRGAFLTGCAIRTSVRDHKLAIEMEYAGLARAGQVALTVVARNGDGTEAKRFNADLAASAGSGVLNASWEWTDPHLWDVDDPHLYSLEIVAQGSGLDDALRETFGFREFRAEGKRFLLNEKEIRLRPTHVNQEGSIAGNPLRMRSFFAGLRSSGFNAIEIWPWNRDERGRPEYDDLWCAEADRLGFLVICPALDFGRLLNEWEKPGVKEDWQKRMVQYLDPLRNHPSVILWTTGANRFGHGQDQNPEMIGSRSRSWINSLPWRKNAERGEEAAAMIKRRDPTRPVLMHAGGAVGDIYTSNNYLCLIPLQEREEWPSRWAADGDMPVLMVEFGTPLYTTFHRGRRGYQLASTSEPLYSEYCAIYQGAEAYRSETPAYRALLASTFQKDQIWGSWHGIEAEQLHSGYMRLQELFIRNTWRAWRTWGVTGGMIPWSAMGVHKDSGTAAAALGLKPRPPVAMPAFVPGQRGAWHARTEAVLAYFLKPEGMIPNPVQEALSGANQETLAWIAGAPEFVDKTHHYRAGQKVEKQVALLNDSRSPKAFDVAWQVDVGGRRIAEGHEALERTPATTSFMPLEFTLPAEIASDTVDGVILLQCRAGEAYHTDRFPFRVFRPAAVAPRAEVAILDPVGDTAAWLESLGVQATPWDGAATDRLLVVGRNAWAKGGVDPARIEPFLRAGGRVLLMAQDPDWMRDQLGLRVARQLTRRGFPTQPFHPALGGLDAEALRDWAGESHLVSPTDLAGPDDANRYPPYGWRWGGRHAISSAAIEVPHRAGWRPLISCEFDSAYTPLAELAIGSGRLIFCTLDLEDHSAADPAAERLARALLAYATSVRAEPRLPVFYLGGPAGSKLLEQSGILHAAVRTLPKTGLVVLGADARVDDAALNGFLKAGGKALILPRRSETAPLGVSLTHVESHSGSLAIPAWPSCRGLLPGELRRRTDGDAWIVTSGAEKVGADGLLAEIRRGAGVAVYFQLDGDALDADHLSYNRLTRWRWTRALAQIASNLGAECFGDRRLFMRPPPPDRISLSGTWKAALTFPLPEIGASDPKPKDPGLSPRAQSLVAKQADERQMREVVVSKEWENYGGEWGGADGEAVFRRWVDIPAHWAGQDLLLSLGAVDDFDMTFFDGHPVGATDVQVPNYWSVQRLYTVPGKWVTPGRHVIAVRVFDHFGGGGMVGQPEQLSLAPKASLVRPLPALYHPDWRDDFPLGDDPYRYYRW